MRRYETIYILRPSLNEEEITKIIDNTNGIITSDSGTVIELDRWGMRKLAYPIKKDMQGFYVYCDYSGTPEAVNELERRFRIDDAVLRFMTVKTADDISDEEIAEAADQASSKKVEAEATDEEAAADEPGDKEAETTEAETTEAETTEAEESEKE